MPKRLPSILSQENGKELNRWQGTEWHNYISYALCLVFLTVKDGCKNTKQKQGT